MNEFEIYFRGEIDRSGDDVKGSRGVGREKGQKWLQHLNVIHSLIQYILVEQHNLLQCHLLLADILLPPPSPLPPWPEPPPSSSWIVATAP